MNEFTASNGVKVLTLEGGIGFQLPMRNVSTNGINSEKVDALREFFQHERDEELGRWRYPDDPRYVVHGGYSPGEEKRFARVVNEQMGIVSVIYEGLDHRSEVANIAAAYFEANPERKPWHDAKHNEIWVVQINGCIAAPEPYRVIDGKLRPVSNPDRFWVSPDSPEITDASRIWPVSDD